jgi:hypothetical protein
MQCGCETLLADIPRDLGVRCNVPPLNSNINRCIIKIRFSLNKLFSLWTEIITQTYWSLVRTLLLLHTSNQHFSSGQHSRETVTYMSYSGFSLFKRLCWTQSVNNATNCSFFLSLSLSTQHVSALNGHLQMSYYYAKAATLHHVVQPIRGTFSIVRNLKMAI